jgi:hypothetical protein
MIPAGEYLIVRATNCQLPEVFLGESLTLRKSHEGSFSLTDSKGNYLALRQAAGGLYFSKNFRPAGAFILPGLARNWNEGFVQVQDDELLVRGAMLEMGLVLFVVPFSDISEWRVTLKPRKAK